MPEEIIEGLKKRKGKKLSREEKALLTAETDRIRQETAILGAQEASAKAAASMMEMDLAQKQRAQDTVLADDFYNCVYRFDEAIDAKSVSECITTLSQWDRRFPDKPFTIIFTSPGGTMLEGLSLWDFLAEIKGRHRLVTVCQGMAASMAGILLQAGDNRQMGKESYLLIHQVEAATMGSWGVLQDRMKWLEKTQERILDIFATRSSLTRDDLKKRWERQDWILDSGEALEAGLVDELV